MIGAYITRSGSQLYRLGQLDPKTSTRSLIAMYKSVVKLASFLAAAQALNLDDAFTTEGQCYVFSTVYPVTETFFSSEGTALSTSPAVASIESSTSASSRSGSSTSSVVPPFSSSSSSSEAISSVSSSSTELLSSTKSIYSSEALSSEPISLPLPTSFDFCSLDTPYSCTNTTNMDTDSCCFEFPGGAVLATQFWDYDPSTGPADSFTIHGLWPDNCDGTYEQYCDTSMEITDPSSIIEAYDPELLAYMQEYWKDYTGDDESLWEHEFNKHGTCYSTLKPACYGANMSDHQEVYDYYAQSVHMFQQLPSYDWLAAAGIVPSDTVTYSKVDFLGALTNAFGATPYIACDSTNAIQEIWYMYHIQGPLVGGNYLPIDTLTTPGCTENIRYPPKQLDTTPTSTHTSDDPLATAPTTKGYIDLTEQVGCLISAGTWYTTGTCATYSLIQLSTGSVYLKSSKGYCTIDSNVFVCSADITTPFEFNYDSTTGYISANGQTIFSADEVPTGSIQETVSLGSAGAITFSLQFAPT